MSHLQRWFLIFAMWAVILAAIFVFYWVQIRPVNIRKMCVKKAKQASQEVKLGFPDRQEIYRVIYSDCCRNNGIKD